MKVSSHPSFPSVAVLVPVLLTWGCSETELSSTYREVEVSGQIDLGSCYIGGTATQSLTITAGGTGWLRMEGIITDHPALSTNFVGARDLDPGEQLIVAVTWQPQDPGSLDARLWVKTNVPDAQMVEVEVSGVAASLPGCDDANPCTDDHFDRDASACRHQPRDGSCDDGNACTIDDICVMGQCRGGAETCADGIGCTLDLCDPATGCRFAPNDDACGDGDPCTLDVCDPDEGCTSSPAPDGTSCGPFTCAEAHLCFQGACSLIDATGFTDDMPCSDNDLCTAGDTCVGGECIAGPVSQNAGEVIATLETFGGKGSRVATDGYRFLFADRDALRVVVQTANGLEQTGRLDLVTQSTPVFFGSGKFLVATYDTSNGANLYMIDATDETAPQIRWTLWLPIEISMYAGVPPTLFLARAGGGAVVASSHTGGAYNAGPYFIPIAEDGASPGAAVLLDSTVGLRDLDADGDRVAWLSDFYWYWARLDASGAILERAFEYTGYRSTITTRLSVEGDRMALITGGQIEAYRFIAGIPCLESDGSNCVYLWPAEWIPTLPTPGLYQPCFNSTESCPTGSTCQGLMVSDCSNGTGAGAGPDPGPAERAGAMPDCTYWTELCLPQPEQLANIEVGEVADLVLAWPGAYTAGAYGIAQVALASLGGWCSPLDPMPAATLDRGPDFLLTSGEIAHPLFIGTETLWVPIEQAPARRSGPLHGDVNAMVETGGGVLLAGPVVARTINLDSLTVESWYTSTTIPPELSVRAIRGDSGLAVVQTELTPLFGGSQMEDGVSDVCYGPVVETLAADFTSTYQTLCDIYPHGLTGSLDVANGRLWTFTSYIMDSIPPTTLRAWELGGADEPVFSETISNSVPWSPLIIRASDNGEHVGILSYGDTLEPAPPAVQLRIYPAEIADELAPVCTLRLPEPALGWYPMLRDNVAIDFPQVMLGNGPRVELYQAESTGDYISLLLDAATTDENIRVLWMRDGRAWVAWRADSAWSDEPLSQYRLSQVSYDSGGLEIVSEIGLENRALRALDTGDVVVVTTESGIVIVAPACLTD